MILDDGFGFGIGAFETIHIFNGRPVFLEKHIDRLNKTLVEIGVEGKQFEVDEMEKHIADKVFRKPDDVLKIMVSQNNTLFEQRPFPYNKSIYEKGFKVCSSSVYRNETSIFTYNKTFNYGDNITEKRKAKAEGYDEVLFYNSKNEVCECSSSNIFFVKNEKIYTPSLSCGLLSGIVRGYLIEKYNIEEISISCYDISLFDEAFVSNSLIGIVPLHSIDQQTFSSMDMGRNIHEEYRREILFNV